MEATHDEKEKNNNEYLFTKVINIEEQNEDYNPTKKINNNSNSINNINSISSTNRLSNNQMMLEVDNNDINQESFHNRKRKAFYTICLSFVLFFGGLILFITGIIYYFTSVENQGGDLMITGGIMLAPGIYGMFKVIKFCYRYRKINKNNRNHQYQEEQLLADFD